MLYYCTNTLFPFLLSCFGSFLVMRSSLPHIKAAVGGTSVLDPAISRISPTQDGELCWMQLLMHQTKTRGNGNKKTSPRGGKKNASSPSSGGRPCASQWDVARKHFVENEKTQKALVMVQKQ